MKGTQAQVDAVDEKIQHWRQGDVSCATDLEFIHLADLSIPHSDASRKAVAAGISEAQTSGIVPVSERVAGFTVLTQTCDIVRSCQDRPFIEVAPLVKEEDDVVNQVRDLKRPALVYVTAMADRGLVADLDRIMTVEKAVVANWTRIPGLKTDKQIREFARAIARKHSRFAFPDDFTKAASRFRQRLIEKHGRSSSEGKYIEALREIRVRAAPSWNAEEVELTIWFIKNDYPNSINSNWNDQAEDWVKRIDQSGRFQVVSILVCRLDDITARDYVESDVLDFDRLSVV